MIEIIDFCDKYAADFKCLNEEWIVEYFKIEQTDRETLNFPQKNIIEKGGFIRLASRNGEIVGACSLLKIDADIFELSKMAVTKKAQGLKIGDQLCQTMLDIARQNGAKKVILITNSILISAIKLYEKYGFQHIDMGEKGSHYERGNVKMELIFTDPIRANTIE